ncbi:MAG: hypothetical protein IJ013_06730 [Bacteroidaceae bacterium]|nr:hypothetical protein [Bacteroidaceae bacterium]
MKQTNDVRQLSIDNITSQAWGLTKKHFLIFLLLTIIVQIIGGIPSGIQYIDYMKVLMSTGDPAMAERIMLESAASGMQLTAIFAGILCLIIQMYPTIVFYRLANDAAKGEEPDLSARLKDGFRGFGLFLITDIVYIFAIWLGTICCLLPGIFLGVRFVFAPIIAALHPERSLKECFAQSWQITKGNFWNLFLLGIIAILLSILGLICCCVGVLVTSIITYFMLILAYRTLSGETEEKAEDFTSENLTVVSE